jgi:hypothetical protein
MRSEFWSSCTAGIFLSLIFATTGVSGEPIHTSIASSQSPEAEQSYAPKVETPNNLQESASVASKLKSTLCGKVVDSQSKTPIANAHVLIVNSEQSHVRYVTETDKDGAFKFNNIAPADWVLTVSREDMLSYTAKVKLTSDETKNVSVSLESIEAVDHLKVSSNRNLLHPDQFGNDTHIDKQYLEQIGNGNSLKTIIETAPGLMPDSLGITTTRGEHYATSYTLDGALLPQAAGVLQQGQFASPRSLQSVDVDVGGNSAADGGAPMASIVRLKSNPIESKPTLLMGTQLGGPLTGSINYYASSALSQDPKSIWNRIRFESSGSFFASKLGLEPPTQQFVRDAKLEINSLSKAEFQMTDRDRLTLHIGINENFMHQPTSPISRAAGVKIDQHDQQNFIMLSYKHRFERFFDEANLHVINSFYSQRISQPNVFDPDPIINGDGYQRSAAVNAQRSNYVISAQGDITKTLFKTHSLKAGFLTTLTYAKTQLSEIVYDANPADSTYGQVISPFTGAPGGPNFTGNMGKYRGSQWVQGLYLQDTWRPARLKRLTLNCGVRFDLAQGNYGNSMALAETISSIPGVGPFNLSPFQPQRVINAQLSGRYAGTYALSKTMLLRASFSNLFVPNPVDMLLTPFPVINIPFPGSTIVGPYPGNGIFNGSPRPLQAERGKLVEAGIDKQFGSRFVVRNNAFFKQLHHMGDSNTIDNSFVYNRLTTTEEDAYGIETRLELKPARDGTGFYGYLSNTVTQARQRGDLLPDGLYWIQGPQSPPPFVYPDHDRRESLNTGFGYRSKHNFWIFTTLAAFTGYMDERSWAIYGPHPARIPPAYFIGLNAGFNVPSKFRRDHAGCPDSIELRIQNLTNDRAAINLGNPVQGTRYALPIRVLVCANWKIAAPSRSSQLAGTQKSGNTGSN